MSKIHFPNLNGLRFFAAFFVVVGHTEQIKFRYDLGNIWMEYSFLVSITNLSVTFFFVLSGFLITYLLLVEKDKYQTISIKKFYIRRIFRIWPLYYLVIFVSLFILPNFEFFYINGWSDALSQGFTTKSLLFIFMLPNLVDAMFPKIPFAHVTWSIGVEEQFYFIWPWIIRNSEKIVKVFFMIIIVSFIIKYGGWLTYHLDKINIDLELFDTRKFHMYRRIILKYLFTLQFEAFAMGSLAAYLLFKKKFEVMNFIFSKAMQRFFLFTLVIMLIVITNFPIALYSLLFAAIILNAAANPKNIIKLNKSVWEYLGKISYGIYMFHSIMIVISIRLLQMFSISFNSFFENIMLHVLVLSLTIFISSLSYHFFEKLFLKKKENFARV